MYINTERRPLQGLRLIDEVFKGLELTALETLIIFNSHRFVSFSYHMTNISKLHHNKVFINSVCCTVKWPFVFSLLIAPQDQFLQPQERQCT